MDFHLFQTQNALSKEVVGKLLRHVVSIFEGCNGRATVKIEGSLPEQRFIDVYVHSRRPDFSELLNLTFRIFILDRKIDLHNLFSSQPGLGGRALSVLYNVAEDFEAGKIKFGVSPLNAKARRIYFHTDFGKPGSSIAEWEVNVPLRSPLLPP